MAPNVNLPIEYEPIGVFNEQAEIIVQYYEDGTMTDFVANQTALLEAAIQEMPQWALYLGCINCGHPVTLIGNVMDTIFNARHNNLVSAYVIPLTEGSRVNVGTVCATYWETSVKCRNCDINLSFDCVDRYNSMILEYFNDDDELCLILSKASLAIYFNAPLIQMQ